MPTEVLGRWLHLYLILDAFSRKIVGFEVHDTDDSLHAAHLAKRTARELPFNVRANRTAEASTVRPG